MRQTIFFAVARDSKLKIRVRHFRRSTNRATMQGLRFRFAGLHFKTTTTSGYFTAVAGIVDDGGGAKKQKNFHRAKCGRAEIHRNHDQFSKTKPRPKTRGPLSPLRAG